MNYNEYTQDYCHRLAIDELKIKRDNLSSVYQGMLRAEGNMWWSEADSRYACNTALKNIDQAIAFKEDIAND